MLRKLMKGWRPHTFYSHPHPTLHPPSALVLFTSPELNPTERILLYITPHPHYLLLRTFMPTWSLVYIGPVVQRLPGM